MEAFGPRWSGLWDWAAWFALVDKTSRAEVESFLRRAAMGRRDVRPLFADGLTEDEQRTIRQVDQIAIIAARIGQIMDPTNDDEFGWWRSLVLDTGIHPFVRSRLLMNSALLVPPEFHARVFEVYTAAYETATEDSVARYAGDSAIRFDQPGVAEVLDRWLRDERIDVEYKTWTLEGQGPGFAMFRREFDGVRAVLSRVALDETLDATLRQYAAAVAVQMSWLSRRATDPEVESLLAGMERSPHEDIRRHAAFVRQILEREPSPADVAPEAPEDPHEP
jgi:hypothetical protein